MTEDKVREEGFEIFKKGLVRRLSPTHYVVKTPTSEGWQIVELRQGGNWTCDCDANEGKCAHLYAAQLHRSTAKLKPDFDEANLKCRYCGSPDIARCGFRYNSRGIARRYICQDCQRKFSVPYVEPQATLGVPSETLWLLSQVAMLTSKLNDLLRDLDERIASANHQRTDKALYETTSCTDAEGGR
jgi:transposase-like protein